MSVTMADLVEEIATSADADDPATLRAAIAHLQAIVEERWADTGLISAHHEPDGFRARLHSPFGGLLAAYCGGVLRAEATVNFVALDVDHPDDGPMVFCVSRRNGHSPVEQLVALKAENAALQSERDRLKEERIRLTAERDGYRRIIQDSLNASRITTACESSDAPGFDKP